MAEAAGFVLAALPLLIIALQEYETVVVEPTKDWWRYNDTLSEMRNHLSMQEAQLSTTLANIGLQKPFDLADLDNIIKARYPTQQWRYIEVIRQMDVLVEKLIKKLDIDVSAKPAWGNELPGRITWEWKRVSNAFGKKRRIRIIEELQFWNSALARCFEKPEVPLNDTDTMVLKIQAFFNQADCEFRRSNAQVLYRSIHAGWNCNCQAHHCSMELNWQCEETSRTRSAATFNLAVDVDTHGSSAKKGWKSMALEIDSSPSWDAPKPNFLTIPVAAKQASTRSVKFLLPHTASSKSNLSTPTAISPKTSIATPSQIICLCETITQGNDISGYIPDPKASPKRRIVIKDLPHAITAETKFLPLSSLLLSPQSAIPLSHQLTRKQRFGIAAAMAWAVLHLAGSPWLNNFWDKEDINVFLAQTATGRKYLIDHPGLVHSFHFNSPTSTAAGPATITSPPKSNPFQSTHIRHQVIFSLGVILIELCLPCSFQQLRQDHASRTGSKTAMDDYDIADSKMHQVYLECERSFGYAVQRCLKMEFPGPDSEKDFDFPLFRKDFFRDVVAPIQAYYVRLPGSASSI